MGTYDPFPRGPHPVGVTTISAVDPRRGGAALSLELWYPAGEAVRGHDLDAKTTDRYVLLPGFPEVAQAAVRDAPAHEGPFPLAAFSHGFGGHRRQSTFVTTHLASHGWMVVAPDHAGNTITDIARDALDLRRGRKPRSTGQVLDESIARRPADLAFALDVALERSPSSPPDRFGVLGHSFGGWTSLRLADEDARVASVVALAPAGGGSDLPTAKLRDALGLCWDRVVPTLFLVAARDSLLPLDGMRALYARVPEPKRMVVLAETDHMHFCDRARQVHEMFRALPPPGPFRDVADRVPSFRDLAPAEPIADAVAALTLAHLDATIAGHPRATAYLATGVAPALAERSIDAELE